MSDRITTNNIPLIQRRDELNQKAELILSSINIVEYIEREYNIVFEEQHGGEYKTRCPFKWHRDSTPSFFANPSKGLFNCFGCNYSGTIIQFVMYIEDISFENAIEKLYSYIGGNASIDSSQITRSIKQINDMIAEYIDRNDISCFPCGIEENKFLMLVNKRIKEYERKVNYDENELRWIETIYQDLDNMVACRNYKDISKFWSNLGNTISEHYRNISGKLSDS